MTTTSPKLLVHVFIGSRLALLVEKGDSMTAGDKAINYLSMFFGGLVGVTVGLIIYRRTMARAAELALEAAAEEEGQAGYEDADTSMMDPEDAAVLMSDDDISLWDRQEEAYRDEVDEDEEERENEQRKNDSDNDANGK